MERLIQLYNVIDKNIGKKLIVLIYFYKFNKKNDIFHPFIDLN